MLRDNVLNPKIIESFYQDREPDLTNVLINSIQILPDEDLTISLNIIVNDFPLSPPRKWVSEGFNTVMMSLKLLEVTDIYLNGLYFINSQSLDIRKFSETELSVSTDRDFRVTCKWIHMDGIDGFKNDTRSFPYDS